jgi:hypothetical protein
MSPPPSPKLLKSYLLKSENDRMRLLFSRDSYVSHESPPDIFMGSGRRSRRPSRYVKWRTEPELQGETIRTETAGRLDKFEDPLHTGPNVEDPGSLSRPQDRAKHRLPQHGTAQPDERQSSTSYADVRIESTQRRHRSLQNPLPDGESVDRSKRLSPRHGTDQFE